MDTYTIIALVVTDDEAEDVVSDGRAINYAWLTRPGMSYDEANGALDLIARDVEASGF